VKKRLTAALSVSARAFVILMARFVWASDKESSAIMRAARFLVKMSLWISYPWGTAD
jgi:hypothetical protein